MRKYEKGHYLFMATKKGLVKKTPLEEYENVRKTGLVAIALRDDDELIEVKTTDNEKRDYSGNEIRPVYSLQGKR